MNITRSKKCRYVNLCEFTNTSDCPDILTGCLLCSAQEPKERTFLLVRISARIVVSPSEFQSVNYPNGYLCNDKEKNCFGISIDELTQYLYFEHDAPKWKTTQIEEFVRYITKDKKLYGLNGEEFDLHASGRSSKRGATISCKIKDLTIEIEDGVRTSKFRVAYRTPGEYFEILPKIFKAE